MFSVGDHLLSELNTAQHCLSRLSNQARKRGTRGVRLEEASFLRCSAAGGCTLPDCQPGVLGGMRKEARGSSSQSLNSLKPLLRQQRHASLLRERQSCSLKHAFVVVPSQDLAETGEAPLCLLDVQSQFTGRMQS